MGKKTIGLKADRRNSYIENDYFPFDLSEITIKTSIDVIILSCLTTDFTTLDNELKQFYRVFKDHRLTRGIYTRKRVYQSPPDTIDLFYAPKINLIRPQFFIALHQPHPEIMQRINSIFIKLSISPKISKIELAWDFYVINIWGFKEFLERHLFLKYQRNSARKYEDTYYTNDIRHSIRGIRVYPRPKDAELKDYVRLELELHRNKIRDLGISLSSLANGVSVDISKFFEFKRWDWEKIDKYLTKKYRKQIAKADQRRPGSGALLRQHIRSCWIRCALDKPMMEVVEEYKSKVNGLPNYSRFLIPLEQQNRIIPEATLEFHARTRC
ncbi:MAG: hypothetical protein V2A69_09635 [Pseudomonadota bacterium]